MEETYQILLGLRERYEAHHKLRYTDEALDSAAKYSSQYISDRFLPDKAIDLIDEAGSRVRLRHAQLPEEARDLDKELRALLKEKDAAVRGQVCASAPVLCLCLNTNSANRPAIAFSAGMSLLGRRAHAVAGVMFMAAVGESHGQRSNPSGAGTFSELCLQLRRTLRRPGS